MINKCKNSKGEIRFDVYGYGINDDSIGMLMLTKEELEQLKADIEAELWALEEETNPQMASFIFGDGKWITLTQKT